MSPETELSLQNTNEILNEENMQNIPSTGETVDYNAVGDNVELFVDNKQDDLDEDGAKKVDQL